MKLIDFSGWPFWIILGLFGFAAIIIAVAGVRMTRVADRLADVSGMGEALFGAVLLGGATSLPGIVTSVWTASEGYAQLSVSNAIGGIAAQTVFLAIADMTYRKINLEHAAASLENLVQATLLMTLLAIPLLAMAGPQFNVLGIHPASPLLLAAYIFGQRLVAKTKATPLWKPYQTRETKTDEAEAQRADHGDAPRLWLAFLGLAGVVAAAGFMVAQTGITIANRTDLSETVVGLLFTAVATSVPELVTSLAAVRQGALALAVGGIIGGNSFDVLFIAFADIAYREGSIYHAITNQQIFIIALTLLLTGILLLGLLRREKSGIANIGFESFLIIVLYAGAVLLLVFG
jgi:cation:H+ antiporter